MFATVIVTDWEEFDVLELEDLERLGLQGQSTTGWGWRGSGVGWGLNHGNLFSRSSEGRKTEIKVLEGLVSSKASLLGWQTATFLLSLHLIFPRAGLHPNLFSETVSLRLQRMRKIYMY